MADPLVSKSLKLPVFDRKAKEYMVWFVRMGAYSACMGFRHVLDQAMADLSLKKAEVMDMTFDTQKIKTNNRKLNALTIAHLTMVFTMPGLINKISASTDLDWLGGLTWKVMKLLKNEYQPNDVTIQGKLWLVLKSLKMGRNNNPSVF